MNSVFKSNGKYCLLRCMQNPYLEINIFAYPMYDFNQLLKSNKDFIRIIKYYFIQAGQYVPALPLI